jgi:hypothetical protein
MELAYEKSIDEVLEIKFNIPTTCASGYFFINASYCFDFNINDDKFNIEFQNGSNFCFGDFNSPSNKMGYYSVNNENEVTDNINAKVNELSQIAAIGSEYIDADEITCYSKDEIIKIADMFNSMEKEAQTWIDKKEDELDAAKDRDTHTYIWIQTQSDTYSYQFDTEEKADEFLAGDNDIMGADICDIDEAYSLCDPDLSNFDIETAYQNVE